MVFHDESGLFSSRRRSSLRDTIPQRAAQVSFYRAELLQKYAVKELGCMKLTTFTVSSKTFLSETSFCFVLFFTPGSEEY